MLSSGDKPLKYRQCATSPEDLGLRSIRMNTERLVGSELCSQ